MSSANHHTEWLSLIEQSGPFLSLPVLLRVFPQGLDTVGTDVRRRLAQAYGEWQASQETGKSDPALHHAWIRFVLEEVLELPPSALWRDQALLSHLKLNRSEKGEILRPDWALMTAVAAATPLAEIDTEAAPAAVLFDDPFDAPVAPPTATHSDSDDALAPRLLIQIYPTGQRLDRTVPDCFWKTSPTARMADLLRAADVPLGLVTNGEDWLLIHAPRAVETASYATWHAGL